MKPIDDLTHEIEAILSRIIAHYSKQGFELMHSIFSQCVPRKALLFERERTCLKDDNEIPSDKQITVPISVCMAQSSINKSIEFNKVYKREFRFGLIYMT
ncbi:CLUMA_CG011857, isoform A [Clunio marinus]|uniref:CLUMA_CG011857, isoform A n=1 Tax=Clunio marinus TaxID=568069 RepID=A0A1J1IG38_9DIPT|nr:CLUMA_CG011857, isoform A [Clunio marinus]